MNDFRKLKDPFGVLTPKQRKEKSTRKEYPSSPSGPEELDAGYYESLLGGRT